MSSIKIFFSFENMSFNKESQLEVNFGGLLCNHVIKTNINVMCSRAIFISYFCSCLSLFKCKQPAVPTVKKHNNLIICLCGLNF